VESQSAKAGVEFLIKVELECHLVVVVVVFF
jgi:hypothetical protein